MSIRARHPMAPFLVYTPLIQYRQNFQSLKITSAHDAAAAIDETAGGYVYDLARNSEKSPTKYISLLKTLKMGRWVREIPRTDEVSEGLEVHIGL